MNNSMLYTLTVEASKRKPKTDGSTAFISPGWFRDNTKYAFLAYLKNYPDNKNVYWLCKTDQEVTLLQSANLPVYKMSDSPSFIDKLFSTKVAVYCTHNTVREDNWLMQACLSGATKIQLWHGPLPKMVGYTEAMRDENALSQSLEDCLQFAHDCLSYDYVVSESMLLEDVYQKSFPSANVLALGSVRAAPLLDVFSERELLGVSSKRSQLFKLREDGKKIILYAPTYREDKQAAFKLIETTVDIISNSIWGEQYHLVIKFHPASSINIPSSKYITCISKSDDIIPYLSLVDTLVTDYSSVVHDFMLLTRPVIFFRPDQEEYKATRVLNEESDLIGPTVTTVAKLVHRLLIPQPIPTTYFDILQKVHQATLVSGVRNRVSDFINDQAWK